MRHGPGSVARWTPALLPIVLAACASHLASLADPPGTAPNPSATWQPSGDFEAPPAFQGPPAQLPPELDVAKLKSGGEITLPQVVAIALANNPATRDAWLQAKAQAAVLDEQLSAWLPTLSADVRFSHSAQAALGGRLEFEQTVADPTLALSWLVYDFGARGARLTEAERALAAADFQQNQTVLDVVLAAEQAYLGYIGQAALVEAEQQAVDAATQSVDAANARLAVGVGTKAEVLQAKTALANERLNLESVSGQLGVLRGSLATAMGLPANLEVNVKVEPPAEPVHELNVKAEALIQKALEARPDLAAARERALEAAARVKESRAGYWPQLSLTASVDRIFFLARPSGTTAATNQAFALDLSVPIFSGLSTVANVAQSEANAEDAKVQSMLADQRAVLEVWTSYFDLKTAARRTDAATQLVTSASESFDVARGRYKEGLGTILDLLTAQTALANARATLVLARAQWSLALAQLAHDAGLLSPANVEHPLGGAR